MNEDVLLSLKNCQFEQVPFKHWKINNVFSSHIYKALVDLPLDPPESYGLDGKRISGASRIFFTRENCSRFSVCDEVVNIFQSPEVILSLERLLDINLSNSYLRIGYYVDKMGFWLKPHTDLDVKLLTMTIYLYKKLESDDIGTDLFDEELNLVLTAPSRNNSGLIFIPGKNTWHGLNEKHFAGLRKLLIINYVTSKWENIEELCYSTIY